MFELCKVLELMYERFTNGSLPTHTERYVEASANVIIAMCSKHDSTPAQALEVHHITIRAFLEYTLKMLDTILLLEAFGIEVYGKSDKIKELRDSAIKALEQEELQYEMLSQANELLQILKRGISSDPVSSDPNGKQCAECPRRGHCAISDCDA